jgi:AraC-like DNA-binding protein
MPYPGRYCAYITVSSNPKKRRCDLTMTKETYPKVYLYRRIVQAKLFIDTNNADTIDLDNIADEAYFSKFHFIRQFKKIYGKTPHQYLTVVRIEKAMELLRTNIPVTEVWCTGRYAECRPDKVELTFACHAFQRDTKASKSANRPPATKGELVLTTERLQNWNLSPDDNRGRESLKNPPRVFQRFPGSHPNHFISVTFIYCCVTFIKFVSSYILMLFKI